MIPFKKHFKPSRIAPSVVSEAAARLNEVCVCGLLKSVGSVVCWDCFKRRTDIVPLKFSDGTFEQWQLKFGEKIKRHKDDPFKKTPSQTLKIKAEFCFCQSYATKLSPGERFVCFGEPLELAKKRKEILARVDRHLLLQGLPPKTTCLTPQAPLYIAAGIFLFCLFVIGLIGFWCWKQI